MTEEKGRSEVRGGDFGQVTPRTDYTQVIRAIPCSGRGVEIRVAVMRARRRIMACAIVR